VSAAAERPVSAAAERPMRRVLRLAAVVAAGAGLLAAGTEVRLPSVDLASTGGGAGSGALAARTTPVDRADLVCPGPETIGVRGVEPVGTAPAPAAVTGDTPPRSVAPSTVTSGSASPRAATDVRPDGAASVTAGALPGGALSSTAAGGTVRASTTGAGGVEITATGAAAPGFVAGQTTFVPSGDLRGLSSAACTAPSDDAWLVGGGTETGRRGRIVLVNPADNPVDVDVDVLGEGGAVRRSPGSSVAVPARSRIVLLLDALAPAVRSPVVHVSTTGGAVAATLSDAWLTGTRPTGVDDAVPSTAPGRRVLVPALLGGGPSSVRLASTGAAEAVAQVRLLGPKGPVDLPGRGVLRVPAGGTRTFDLGTLTPGGYLVEVRSDEPVVAGALVRRNGPTADELAWFGSTGPAGALAGAAGLGSGPGWTSSIVVGAPVERAQADLVTRAADGTSRSIPLDLAAGTTTTVPVSGVAAGTVAAWVRPRPGSGELFAASATTRQDPSGPLVTGVALRPAVLSRRLPVVVPER